MVIAFQGYQVEILQYGKGRQHLMAFHGFGQDASTLSFLEPIMGEDFTIHSFALFHHGKSVPPAGFLPEQAIPVAFYPEFLRWYLAQENIAEFSLLGNSMGGRICLFLAPFFEAKIRYIFLFAPDGLKKNFWYHFATTSPIGKRIFKFCLQKPAFFFKMVRFFTFLGIVHPKLEKFALSQFSSPANREKVFKVWNIYARLVSRPTLVKSLVLSTGIRGIIFTGKRDPVLDKTNGDRFIQGIESQFRHISLDSGHDLWKEKFIPVLRENIENCLQAGQG